MLMIALEQNKPEELLEIGRKKGMKSETIARRKAGLENLYVLKFARIRCG